MTEYFRGLGLGGEMLSAGYLMELVDLYAHVKEWWLLGILHDGGKVESMEW
jgi:hypothetical protein